MEIDELTLQTGNDIPFPQAQVTIHQPKIKEIGLIGEEDFYIGSHFLAFDRNRLNLKDKDDSEKLSDFEIFMSVMNSIDRAKHKTDALMVLALLFPEYKFKIAHDKILLFSEKFSSSINEQNFDIFKSIIIQIFCLKSSGMDGDYNPEEGLATKIAEKLRKRKEKLAGLKGKDSKLAILSKYISILSVGLGKDKNDLSNYTIPQLKNEFDTFIAKYEFDSYLQAKLAGVKDLEEVKNWME